jgi:NAD(P)-dependent dehydrogenase (short-subunit alcohol dehydrogenase family)
MRGLKNRRFLVAGGASGIGAATARRLADEGSRVIVADRTGDAAAAVANEIGSSAEWFTYEQGDAASVAELFDKIARGGPLHGLAIVAGVHLGAIPLSEIKETDYTHIHGINVLGALHVLQHAVASLADDGRSSIVVVSSVAGIRPEPFDATYASSKAAVQAIARSAALELAPRGIRVNSVLPGSALTPLAVSLTSLDEIVQDAVRIVPMGRAANPAEVASAITFLLSDDASYITGTELIVDGGLWANSP